MKQPKQTQHRLHVILATVPTVMLIESFILDLFNIPTTTREPSIALARIIFCLIGIGLVVLVIASLPAVADYSYLSEPEPVRSIARRHVAFGALAFLFFWGSMVSRFMGPSLVGPPLVPIYLSAFGTGFIVYYASYLGYRITHSLQSSPNDDILTYDRMREWRSPMARIRNMGNPPGTIGDPQWKEAEEDERRWHMEPRVDADGMSV